ncbi:hypothetical protein EQM14_12875 [Caproiciproducens sp. NJN-50]|uniref:hypothetical protein n=1 Tax=Acutalibacteraceae TaxID=3082771 RepID=UPI000FFE18B3|nr:MULTISPECIES: hypothetical protein [Acutalibacteraceae]QAT50582.1 hypothetical protein EQM14_12875 [Caproiciproducens sp. NJN-50]
MAVKKVRRREFPQTVPPDKSIFFHKPNDGPKQAGSACGSIPDPSRQTKRFLPQSERRAGECSVTLPEKSPAFAGKPGDFN